MEPNSKRQRILTSEREQQTTTTASCAFTSLPEELRVRILQNLNQEDLGNVETTSRQCRADCRNPSLPQGRTVTMHCNASHFVALLWRIERRDHMFSKRFTKLKLVGHGGMSPSPSRDTKSYVKYLCLQYITSLDMSLPPGGSKKSHKVPACMPKVLSQILPMLKEVDFSYNDLAQSALCDLAKNCPGLEKITSNAGISTSFATGQDLKECQNLKEIYMDDTRFYIGSRREAPWKCYESTDSPYFLFVLCYQKLECVSIKNATYYVHGEQAKPVTQLALIKFVRSAPCLRWFRSDLTLENIAILKQEFPNIVFVS